MVSSPKAPNPYQQASAQQGAEQGAALASSIINNPNEINPYGSVNYQIAGWEQVPDAQGKMTYVPRYTRTTQLSPDEQRIAGYDTATRSNLGRTATSLSAKMGPYLQQGVDSSGWTPWSTARGFSEATDRPAIEKALLSRWEENTGRANTAQDVQMAARGLSSGASQYAPINTARSQARTDAAQQAYLASGQEARSNYDAYLAGLGFNNQTRQGQASEALALRNQPINEITALLSGAQVNVPQFAPFSRQGISSAPIGQYMQDSYAQQSANANAMNQGIFNLAGSVAGAGGYWAGNRK